MGLDHRKKPQPPGRRAKRIIAGMVLIFGASLNIGAHCDHARRLHDLGFNVLLISYRGFGRSEGQFPSEQSVYQDAAAAWDYLT